MNEKTRRPNRVFTPEQKYEILKDITLVQNTFTGMTQSGKI